MDEPQKHARVKEARSQDYALYDTFYMKILENVKL